MRLALALLLVLLACATPISPQALPDGTYIQLFHCDGSFRQQWDISRVVDPNGDKTIRLKTQQNMCLDINGWSTTDGSQLHLWDCHTDDKDPTHQNQEFIYNANAQTFTGTQSGKCIEASNSGLTDGTAIWIWTCSGAANQKWVFNAADSTLKGAQSGLCLDAGSTNPAACSGPPTSDFPFCNTKLSIDDRVNDLVQRIPTATKWNLLGSVAGPVSPLGIAPYKWGAEGLHGVAGSTGVDFIGNTTCATSFPQVCTTGASFDTDLYAKIGDATSTEARAFFNAGHAGLTFWTPNLNIFRDPRWGRGQEVPGEDPYHTAQYVRYYVNALQNSSVDPKHLKISACCKHFAAYSFEHWGGQDRCGFNSIVTNQDLTDTFYPQFETCISPNGAASAGIMCSYNAINGIPACADGPLLTTLARQQWKFNGYITGDCGAVDCVQNNHHYTSDTSTTCKVVLNAGMDLDCGDYLQKNLATAVANGAVTSTVVDSALKNLMAVHMRLGLFDPPSTQPYLKIGIDQINTDASQKLALRAAQEGIVLLKNDKQTLPLKLTTDSTVAVIGPNAQATTVMQGNYFGKACVEIITPLLAIGKFVKTNYAQGATTTGTDTSGFAAACTAAKNAKATIIIGGLTNEVEHEGIDRNTITWPGVQQQLIDSVVACAVGPVVLVVFGGGPIDLTSVRDNKLISSILWTGYGGQAGGVALANAIFGVFSPAGRLPHTVYPANFVNLVPDTDMGFRPSSSNPGRTYRFYTGTPVYEYGYGLSYTNFTFKYTNISNSVVALEKLQTHLYAEQASFLTAPTIASVSVEVTNNGEITSDVVVLAFMVGPNAGKNGNPLKSLFGFTRFLAVAPHTTKTIVFPVTAFDLSVVDDNGKRAPEAGRWKIVVENNEIGLKVV